MKMKTLILPLAMLLALPSCATNKAALVIENGRAPEGGTKITEKELADKELANLATKFAHQIDEKDELSIKANFEGLEADFSSTRFNSNLSISDFKIDGGFDHLFEGKEKDVTGFFEFSGASLNYRVDAEPEDESIEPTHLDKSVSIGNLATYISKGNLYLDASRADLFETVRGTVSAIEPFYSSLADQYEILELAGPYIDLFLQEDTSRVEEVFDDFGYKFYLGDANLTLATSFASALKAVDNVDASQAANKIKEVFKDNIGLDWDEVASIYKYDDGSKVIQFDIDNDKLLTLIDPEDVEYYNLELTDSHLTFAIGFDGEGFPTAFGLDSNVNAESDTTFFNNVLGSPLTFNLNTCFSVEITHELASDYSIPSDLNNYKTLPALALKLTPLLLG